MTQWRNDHLPRLLLCHRVTLKDHRVTALFTWWTTPSVTTARNLYVQAPIGLCMSMVTNSDVEILSVI